MKRRNFLLGALELSSLTCPATLYAQTIPHGMGAMAGMGGEAPGGASTPASVELAANDAIPAGAMLAELPRLQNESVTPGLFRATLIAAPATITFIPGRPSEVWTYNGMTPPPLIELNAGDRVEITLVNRLRQPTTLHWHGLPVPAEQDGNPAQLVAPGASRVYRFTVPSDVEGLYWYHPHPHPFSAEQVYRGLAGAILVRPAVDPLAELPQRVLMVTDLKLNQDASIAENDTLDWMNGREGQFVLVNGQRQPRLSFSAEGRERWRILNATNARYLRLQLPGHGFTLVGTDGGLMQSPQTGLREWLLAPAQRIDLVVESRSAGTTPLLAAAYDRGKMGRVAKPAPIELLHVEFGVRPQPGAALPAILRQLPNWGPASAHKQVTMSETMSDGAPHMAFLLNGRRFDMQRIDLSSRVGAVEQWEIINRSDMDHPFHIHGTQFIVLENELHGRVTRPTHQALYDTVNLKSGETVRIKLVQSLPGIRMYHCHLLEHEVLGMMGQLQVS